MKDSLVKIRAYNLLLLGLSWLKSTLLSFSYFKVVLDAIKGFYVGFQGYSAIEVIYRLLSYFIIRHTFYLVNCF
jgi:hypothetical protein